MADIPYKPTIPNKSYVFSIYKPDFALINLQGLTCHQTQTKRERWTCWETDWQQRDREIERERKQMGRWRKVLS